MSISAYTVLAIDASTERCSVALNQRGQITSQVCNIPRSHAQALLPMVDALLNEAEITLKQLDAIVVTLGPGSFTGIRICLSVAQGLSYGANIPLIGANSLEVMAQGLIGRPKTENATLVSCLDARMGEVYWATYTHQNGLLTEVLPPAVSSPEQFNIGLKSVSGTAIGIGHGFQLPSVNRDDCTACYSEELPHAEHLLSLWSDDSFKLALRETKSSEIEPLYLRNEVAWEKRTRIRTQN